VSYRIGEGPCRSSSQPTLFISFWEVLKNNTWKSNNNSYENKANAEHGEENVQMNAHAYIQR